jgi:hypothetical protein
MATFLTNRKMSPGLRARIETSVSGRKSTGPSPAFVRALARFGILVMIIAIVVWLSVKKREGGQLLERERASLLDLLHATTASVTDDDRRAVARDEAFILKLASTYEGDLIPDELRAPNALKAVLARPLVYVRGPVDAFANSAAIERAAAASVTDTFLTCLIEPPRARTESHVVGQVRAASKADLSHVHRLADAYRGLTILDPSLEQRVRAARDLRAVTKLRTELERTPLDLAKQAWRAAILVIVVDEPGDPNTIAEFDGERPHDVRVEIADVVAAKVLFRLRRHVDPSVWSASARVDYASGLDGCALAFDVHESLRP